MSIIYDALKKVEEHTAQGQNGAAVVQAHPVAMHKKRRIFIFILAVCLGFISAGFIYKYLLASLISLPKALKEVQPSPVVPLQPQTNVTAIPSVTAVIPAGAGKDMLTTGGLALNGIFFSGEESYALVNNLIVKTGDTVDGWTVSEILMEEVELSKEGIKKRLRKK